MVVVLIVDVRILICVLVSFLTNGDFARLTGQKLGNFGCNIGELFVVALIFGVFVFLSLPFVIPTVRKQF